MRVSRLIALSVLFAGCAVRTPATPIAPGLVPAAPPPVLSGAVGNRPFVARSAIMLKPNKWNDGSMTQTLRIFERPMDCPSADALYWGDSALPGERFFQITIGGQWPMFPTSTWRASLHSGGGPQARDGSGVDFSFEHIRGGGGGSGVGMAGEMIVREASRGSGVISITAHRTFEDMRAVGVADKDIDADDLGSLAGNVGFIVCEGGRGG